MLKKVVITFAIERDTFVVTVSLDEHSNKGNKGSNILVYNSLSSLHKKK